jgi:hypothetical protein
MKKLCLLLAFNLVWMIPAPAGADEANTKGGALAPSVYEWTTVEINGMLDYDDGGLRPRIPEFGDWIGYSVTADGKWFGIDFNGNKELEEVAKKLIGKRVVVKGKVEERTLDGFIPHKIKVVVASEFGAAAEEKEGITVQLTGKFQMKTAITYLHEEPAITVHGQTYVIDFEGAEGLLPAARILDGKMVVLTGKLYGDRMFPVMCRPEEVKLPALLPASMKAADEKAKEAIVLTIIGKLERLPVDPIDPWFNLLGHPTGWVVHVNGRTYAVSFADDKMRKLADKLDGRMVHLAGALEKETRVIGIHPTDKLIDWQEDILPIEWQVEILRVSELKALAADSVEETVHLQVVGALSSVNLMGPPPAVGWMVKTGEQTFQLQFSPDPPKELPGQLEGKQVFVSGTRVDAKTIYVTGLRDASDR